MTYQTPAAILWRFDETRTYPGFRTGTTRTGLPQISVTPETHAKVVEDVLRNAPELDTIEPGVDGLISYGWTFTPMINDDALITADDGLLDDFLRDYCTVNGIECDGDVFGQVFCDWFSDTGDDRRDVKTAVARIVEAALTYNLFLPLNGEDRCENCGRSVSRNHRYHLHTGECAVEAVPVAADPAPADPAPDPDRPMIYHENRGKILAIARAFGCGLQEELSTSILRQAIDRNKAEDAEGICHTHDFCDSNVIMNDAFVEVTGRDADVASGFDAEIINCAWDIAKEADYYI